LELLTAKYLQTLGANFVYPLENQSQLMITQTLILRTLINF